MNAVVRGIHLLGAPARKAFAAWIAPLLSVSVPIGLNRKCFNYSVFAVIGFFSPITPQKSFFKANDIGILQ
jgi:hypothetical protein